MVTRTPKNVRYSERKSAALMAQRIVWTTYVPTIPTAQHNTYTGTVAELYEFLDGWEEHAELLLTVTVIHAE